MILHVQIGSDLYLQSDSLRQARLLRQPKTDGYSVMQQMSLCNVENTFGTAQRCITIILEISLSYETEIYSVEVLFGFG